MNIFYLDRDPQIAAQMMCDKHVVKMILESAQMLSTAHRVCGGAGRAWIKRVGLYKMTHRNHPSTIWARYSFDHYVWLYKHMVALMKEYTYRYGKHHKTERLIEPLSNVPAIYRIGFTDPPQCMPKECKEDDTVSAYQTYYILEKSGFATWKRREEPLWWKENLTGATWAAG